MSINYPTSLDTLTDPDPTDTQAAVSHSTQHAKLNAIAEALETKVGTTTGGTPSNLLPETTNTYTLGNTTLRWKETWCNAAAFNSSDERIKDWRGSLSDAELRVARRLGQLIGTYQFKDAVAEKGWDKARLHTGVIAQRVAEAFQAEGLDWQRYGLIGYDEDDGGGLFSIRYEELWGFIIAGQEQRLAALERG